MSTYFLQNFITSGAHIPEPPGILDFESLRIANYRTGTDTGTGTGTGTGTLIVRVRVNSSVRRAGRDRVRVSNQDVVETGYAPSS
jgi:hypothetical protein